MEVDEASMILSLTVHGVPVRTVEVLDTATNEVSDAAYARIPLVELPVRERLVDAVVVRTPELAVIVPRELRGTPIGLAASMPARFWFVGCNSSVYCLDWRAATVQVIDGLSPFRALESVGRDSVIAIFEASVARLDGSTVVWRNDTDIITHHAVWPDHVNVRTYDGGDMTFDLRDGSRLASRR
jgi:hypothetical protein